VGRSSTIRNQSYDNASRITSITDSTTSAYTWSTLGYDVLDRLTSAVDGSLTIKWSYDANGNRLTQTYASASTFNISSTSNQITSTTGALVRTYAYDAAGNPTSYGTSVLAYNDRGRLASDTVGGTSSTMVYNALGQMIEYTFGSTSTVLVYDEAGHILGEYTTAGGLMREYIWMGDIPVAEIVPSGSSVAVYYIHTDQLNAPRKISLPSTNALAWRWDPHPFGEQTPNQNPSGLGTFINNLRFPGQFYTYESGLNHNGFRDYDPQTGKYLQSDPIGLYGGSYSTYAYVGGNPISRVDPSGLATWYGGTSGAGAFGPWGVTGGEGSYYDTTTGKFGFYNFNGDAKGLILDAGYNFGFQTGNSCDFKDKSKYVTIDIVFFSVSLVSNSTSWGLNFGAGIGLGYGFGTTNTDIHPR
jgi:RHS repeat-associated protein